MKIDADYYDYKNKRTKKFTKNYQDAETIALLKEHSDESDLDAFPFLNVVMNKTLHLGCHGFSLQKYEATISGISVSGIDFTESKLYDFKFVNVIFTDSVFNAKFWQDNKRENCTFINCRNPDTQIANPSSTPITSNQLGDDPMELDM